MSTDSDSNGATHRRLLTDVPETLSGFIDETPPSETVLLVVNRSEPEQLIALLRRAFDDQPVDIESRHVPEGVDDTVLLIDDGTVVATTPLQRLRDTFLLVNSDWYRTANRHLTAGAIPDVLTGLTDTEFSLRGFPASNKEKLLLIVLTRFIERRALRVGDGRLDVSFQRLSRLDDEYGTKSVYEQITATDVTTHLYGVRDGADLAVDSLPATVHAGASDEYHDNWFVVFVPPPDHGEPIALLATETGQNRWRSMWTTDPDTVARIGAYVRTGL